MAQIAGLIEGSMAKRGGGDPVSGQDHPLLELNDSHGELNARRELFSKLTTGAPLLLVDCLSVAVAMFVACAIASLIMPEIQYVIQRLLRQIFACVAATPVVFSIYGLYPGVGLNPVAEFRHTILATTVVAAVVAIVNSFFGTFMPFEMLWLGIAWLCIVASLPLIRVGARRLFSKFRWWGKPVIVVGNGQPAASVFTSLKEHAAMGMRPIGIVGDPTDFDDEPLSREQSEAFLATLEELPQVLRERAVTSAVLTMDGMSPQVVDIVSSHVPNLVVLPDVHGAPSLWNRIHDCNGRLAIHMTEQLLVPESRLIKRVCDLLITSAVLLIAVPLIAIFALLIKANSPGPVFYRQRRIGKSGERFWMWKFRTMGADADEVLERYLEEHPSLRAEWEQDHKLRHDPRVTTVGRFLRKTSLDELPQIWNVLRGEMSLVGPRPIVAGGEGRAYFEDHPDAFARYKKVVPGITGLWQISGRNHTTYARRVALDSYYVRNWSPWFDAYILVRTIWVVLSCQGAY